MEARIEYDIVGHTLGRVPQELPTADESTTTTRAHKWSLCHVRAFVPKQVVRLCKAHATHFTSIRTFSSVSAPVHLQFAAEGKAQATLCAVMRLARQ